MSTTRKTVNAAIGAGAFAVEKARAIPGRVASLPGVLADRQRTFAPIKIDVGALQRRIAPSALPKTVQELTNSGTERAGRLAAEAKELPQRATKRAKALYAELATRGEAVVSSVRGSKPAPKKASKPRTKAAPKTNGASVKPSGASNGSSTTESVTPPAPAGQTS